MRLKLGFPDGIYVICNLAPQIHDFTTNGDFAKLQEEYGYYIYNRQDYPHSALSVSA